MELDSINLIQLADSFKLSVSEYLQYCHEFEQWCSETYNEEQDD